MKNLALMVGFNTIYPNVDSGSLFWATLYYRNYALRYKISKSFVKC